MSAIVVDHLTKRFGQKVAVDRLSVDVARGETVVLWGANGAGKTTVMRCILGLIPYEGAIRVCDLDAQRDGKAVRRLIGYVPQELGLAGDPTVEELLLFYARLRRVQISRAMYGLEHWQLDRVKQQPVRTLSGGMKQKLALAIALVSDPPVLLLDEPTSNLDVKTRGELSALVERLKREGKTLLLCSHRVSEVVKLADRVIVLEEGRRVEEGALEDVRNALMRDVLIGIVVPAAQRQKAASVLQQHGFSVQVNGVQLWVSLGRERKIEPLQCLLDADISVLDFEVESNHGR